MSSLPPLDLNDAERARLLVVQNHLVGALQDLTDLTGQVPGDCITVEDIVRNILSAVLKDDHLFDMLKQRDDPQTYRGSDLVYPANVLAAHFKAMKRG